MPKTPKLDAVVTALAGDLKSLVRDIEADPLKTTQNNYGRYMNVLGLLGKGNYGATQVIALALIEAGANRAGVASALKIYGG